MLNYYGYYPNSTTANSLIWNFTSTTTTDSGNIWNFSYSYEPKIGPHYFLYDRFYSKKELENLSSDFLNMYLNE